MRRISSSVVVAALLVSVMAGGETAAQARTGRQLTTAQLRPLVLTTEQAVAASGFGGSLAPGSPTGFRCGKQQPRKATYCSRMWESSDASAHPSLVTAASFPSVRSARGQISDEVARAKRAGTLVRSSNTVAVAYYTGFPDVGTAAIAQQAIGSSYAFAWCSSAPDLPPEPTVKCAEDLLAAQATQLRSR